jgi:hypothetical protein
MTHRPQALLLAALALSPALGGFAVPVDAAGIRQRETRDFGLTRDDLEQIRAAAIRHYRDAESEPKSEWRSERGKVFVAELEGGGIFLEDEEPVGYGPAVGVWRYDLCDGRPALIREPDVPDKLPALLVYFGLFLSRQDGGWEAGEEFEITEKIVDAESEE